MGWVRLVLRVFGWLLTPFLAWAASFFGAVLGSVVAMRLREPRAGLVVTAAIGALSAFLTILVWLRILRRSPHVREALAVDRDGTPDIVTAHTAAESANPLR